MLGIEANDKKHSIMAKPDSKVMEEVATLKAMKDSGFVDTPEYNQISKDIKRKYFGDPIDRRKKNKVTPPVYDETGRQAGTQPTMENASASDSDEPPSDRSTARRSSDASGKSGGNERTVARRFKRRASTEEKMEESCKNIVYVHKNFGDLQEVTVPYRFTNKEGNEQQMWVCCDDGRWRCNLCPRKHKDVNYDPEGDPRLDSKLCHNRYRTHYQRLLMAWKPPSGCVPLEWGKRFEKYKEAVAFYNASDLETRKGLSLCFHPFC